jgi:4-phytase / acid phosphatase
MWFKSKIILPDLLLTLATAAPFWAQTITNAADDTILKQIVIFGRYSVRAPLLLPSDLAKYSAKPFPEFGVPPGYLTPHGAQAEVLLGAYYRDYLMYERLLTGHAESDAARSYFRSNSIQRSNVTAAALAAGLFPGITVPVYSYPLGQPDPVFDPITTKVAAVDPVRAGNEVQALFHSGAALASSYSGELSLIRSVLFGYPNGTQPPPATPSGLVDATSQAIPLTASTTGAAGAINVGGLLTTLTASDPFVMQYTNGLPLKDVAWGQLSLDALSQQTRIVNLCFNVEFLTPYLNQVQSSNAASHVLRSMEQAVIGDVIPGAFGDAKSRLNVIISSDTYVAGLAGLLHLHWQLPGYQPDFCAPGGALVFELRQSRSSREYVVRAFYTAQTFDQLRNLTPLTLQQPPATAQLLIPGGRTSGTGLDVKFASFQKLLRSAIDQKYVQDPSIEIPPGVLTGVPLK